MKLSSKTKKIVLAGLVCAIPLGLLAHDKYEDKYEGKHDDHKEMFTKGFFTDKDDDHDSKYERELYEKKGVNYIFEGKLESKPANSLSGIWKISGKSITVDDKTMIFQSKEPFKVGDEVYVAAKREGTKIIAIELEQDD